MIYRLLYLHVPPQPIERIGSSVRRPNEVVQGQGSAGAVAEEDAPAVQQAFHLDVLPLAAVRAAPTEQHDGRTGLATILPIEELVCIDSAVVVAKLADPDHHLHICDSARDSPCAARPPRPHYPAARPPNSHADAGNAGGERGGREAAVGVGSGLQSSA